MSQKNNQENLIYHFTNKDAFESIITNKKLWLSCASSMNDTEEVDYAYKVLIEAYKELYSNQPIPAWITEKRLQNSVFLCSLSRAVNIDSQWISYADNNKGLAIGFDGVEMQKSWELRSLERTTYKSQLVKAIRARGVQYDLEQQKKYATNIIKNRESYDSQLISFGEERDFICTTKNSSWSRENEVRIVIIDCELTSGLVVNDSPSYFGRIKIGYQPINLNSPKITITIDGLTKNVKFDNRHQNVAFDCELIVHLNTPKERINEEGKKVPYFELPILHQHIKEVYIGSQCEFNKEDVKRILIDNGYTQPIQIYKRSLLKS